MVAPVVRYFWQQPVTCNVRQLLYRAQASLERGSAIEARCHLREAMRVYLQAECVYRCCLPKQTRPPAPRVMARALKRAGHFSQIAYECISDMIEVGNKAAHLVIVQRSSIASALEVMHEILDGSPHPVDAKKGARS